MYIDKINNDIDIDYIKLKLDLYENDMVFTSGSVIENIVGNFSKNIGNIDSDIDIFIIKNDFGNNTHIDYDEGFSQIYFRNYNGMLIDVTVYLKKDIYNLLENINNVKLDKNKRIKNSLKLPGKWDIE